MGFSTPLDEWFRSELKEFSEKRIQNKKSGLHSIFNGNAIERVWNEHQSKQRNHGIILWSMLMYQLWHERYAA